MFHIRDARSMAGMTNQFKTSLESRKTVLTSEHRLNKFPFQEIIEIHWTHDAQSRIFAIN